MRALGATPNLLFNGYSTWIRLLALIQSLPTTRSHLIADVIRGSHTARN